MTRGYRMLVPLPCGGCTGYVPHKDTEALTLMQSQTLYDALYYSLFSKMCVCLQILWQLSAKLFCSLTVRDIFCEFRSRFQYTILLQFSL